MCCNSPEVCRVNSRARRHRDSPYILFKLFHIDSPWHLSVLAPTIRLISPGIKVIKLWTMRQKNIVLISRACTFSSRARRIPTIFIPRNAILFISLSRRRCEEAYARVRERRNREARDFLFIPLLPLLSAAGRE